MKKKLTILHFNDLHGDFLPAKGEDGKERGGLPRFSGYVKKVRKEEETVILANAGDMFRGSIIDSEYMGLSTIELMNLLAPDVTTIGNHEVDYGLAHLLFLERCARFPIINANLFVTLNNTRLFKPCLNVEINGIKILFIGILTEEVLAKMKGEKIVGTYVDVKQAAKEIGIITDNYRTKETDMVVLLTHIGIEADRELAKELDPEWGVNLIIGGHSHTLMEEPEVVNNVTIVQAGTGTGHMGRFDLTVDTDTNSVSDLKWQCIEINEDTAEKDEVMEEMLHNYSSVTDAKYKRVITTFQRKLTHPGRIEETEVGNLYADLLQADSSFDIMMMGTGAIRKKEIGPIVDYQTMLENTPFDDMLWMMKLTGAQFKHMLKHVFRDEAWEGHTEFYNYSRGVRIVNDKASRTFEDISFRGKPVEDDDMLLVAIQSYHFKNLKEFLDLDPDEIAKNMKPRVVATSVNNIVEEYLSTNKGLDSHVEGRIVVK